MSRLRVQTWKIRVSDVSPLRFADELGLIDEVHNAPNLMNFAANFANALGGTFAAGLGGVPDCEPFV